VGARPEPRDDAMSRLNELPPGATGTTEFRARRRRTTRIWVGVLLGVLAGNLLAASLYFAMNSGASESSAPPPTADEAAMARAHREIGIEALERDDYAAAVAAFTRALEAPDPPDDVAKLLKIARDLQAQTEAVKGDEGTAAEKRSPPPAARRPPRRRAPPAPVRAPAAAAKTPAAVEEAPAEEEDLEATAARAEPDPAETSQAAGEGAGAEAAASDGAAAEGEPEELPLCPEGYEPPPPSTPYAILPRKCRPR